MRIDETQERLARELAQVLRARGLRVATAESCTGGLIAALITSVAGSSEWFERGFVTYSNASKCEMLDVPADVIEAHGAVSEPVARAMAQGALAKSAADCALSVTGVAGPGGGTGDKPVGLVCLGWLLRGHAPRVATHHFPGDRTAIRAAALEASIAGLVRLVADQDRASS
jgi:nicotinamide-nucleotide amidase